jgi:hypothetical protein
MSENIWVKWCGECPTCRFTRNCDTRSISFKIARALQRICPICIMANWALKKNFQERQK